MSSERTLSPWWVRAYALGGLALLLSVVAWWPMFAAYPYVQNGDGEYFLHMVEAAKVSVVRYHELPLWMPYDCGGAPLWDNPESIVASPLVLLTTRLTSLQTIMLWYVTHVAAGFVCMWLFARHEFGSSRLAAFVASSLWAFGVAHASQYSGGHDSLVAFLYAPLALLLWRRAENDPDMAVGLGLLVGWMFYDGATYPLPHTALLLGAETLTRAWPPRRIAAIAKAGAIVLVVGFAFGAPRLLPIADQFAHHERIMQPDLDDLLRWSTLHDMYLARSHGWGVEGQQYVWGEYIAYMGIFTMALAFVGVLVSGVRNLWFFAVGLAIFALMLGHFSPHAPWSILQGHVYPFTSMRVPARFRLLFAAFIAMYVALAVDRAPLVLGRLFGHRAIPALRTALVGMALLGAGDVLGNAADVIASKFVVPPPLHEPQPAIRMFYEGPGLAPYLQQPQQNRGRMACTEHWIYTAGAPVWPGDVPQARPADDAAIVEVANRTQNTFTVDVVASRPARIRVNSGYDRGWRTDVGTVHAEKDLLVVDVPAGRHRINLKYWPHGLTAGLWLGPLALLGSLVFLLRKRIPWSKLRRPAP